ncbi:ribonuclease H-like domain-containing protein [Tanacetum coccineum]
MSSITAQQTKLDLELVPKENRLDIGKCNGRIPHGFSLREPTFQVVLDALALTPCYPAFLIMADVPEVYMHLFWNCIYKHDDFYIFKIDKKKRFKLTLEVFRDILQICLRVQGRDFDPLPSEEDIVSFLRDLGHTRVQFGFTVATIGSVGPTITPGQETTLPHAFTAATLHDPTIGSWNMDTGASSHLNSSVNSLSENFNTCMYPSISVGDGHSIPVTNTGHSILPTPTRSLHLNNVLIIPHIVKNLIYVRQVIRDNNCTIEFDAFGFFVKDFLTRRVLLRCDSTRNLYPVTAPSPIPHAFLVSQHMWHQSLGHPEGEVLRHACQLGKHVKLPFVSSDTVISSCFDIIHSDVWTSPIPSLSGFKYYVLFLDHYSQFVWVYPLVNKSYVMLKFVLFRNYVHTQFKCEIKSFQCDHGGEFDNRRLHTLFAKNGIQFLFLCPQTSQQNGKSERMVRTINNLIRTLLFQANLPPTFWVEALNMAIQLLNILPSTTSANDIPYTRLYGKDPNYTLLRIFGCLCYPHLYPSHKLEPRATPSIFLGFASSHRGYRCLDLHTNKIIISRHVTFDETVFPYGSTIPKSTSAYTFLEDTLDLHPTLPNPTLTTQTIGQTDPLPHQQHQTEPATQQSPTAAPPTPASPSSAQIHSPVQQPSPMAQHTPIQLQFSPTTVSHQTTTVSDQHAPAIIQNPPVNPNPDSVHPMVTRFRVGTNRPTERLNLHVSSVSPLPKSYRDAFNDPNWQNAMRDEYIALIKNKTWTLVPRPPYINIVRCMWLFRHKHLADDNDLIFPNSDSNTSGVPGPPPDRGRPTSYAAGTSGTRTNTSGTRGNYLGQQRVVKCFNCQREGHMARHCPKPKRKIDAMWFRDKVLLIKDQGNGKVLNKEELEFLADASIVEGPVTQSVITHNAGYQADDLDAYDSDCDEISTAKAVLMTNLYYEENLMANETLSAELERYKERFADFEKEINSLKQTLSEQLKEKESLTKTFNVFKNESKEKEAKNIDNEIYLEKKVKELDNIVHKMGQSVQTKAQQIRPMLYDGNVIAKETNVISIADLEETLMLEEESQSKMLLKQSDLMVLENMSNFRMPNPSNDSSAASPVKVDVPSKLIKYSVDKQCLEIANKQALSENDRLLEQIISQDIVNIVVNSSKNMNASVNVNENSFKMCNKCLELEAKLFKQHNMVEKDEYNKLSKSYSKLKQHCISLKLAMQLNKENFQTNNTSVNQNEPTFDQLFELNNLKAELQAKDMTIKKLKAHIKRVNESSTSESLKKDIDEIETINI